MRTRTARRTIRIPLQALGLSLLFAGTALATSAPSMTATSMVSRAAPSTRVISGPPHQAASVDSPNQGLLTTPTAVSTRLFSGVPHQAASVDGPNEALLTTPTAVSASSFNGVPHQAALPR